MNNYRTHMSGTLTGKDVGQTVTLSGWVHKRRDIGKVIFIILRDKSGLVQLLFDPEIAPGAHTAASQLRAEFVIQVTGEVSARAKENINSAMATGDIEIEVQEFSILSKAKTPPFAPGDEITEVSENLRLKYRYLDMRRNHLRDALTMRHRAMQHTRSFFTDREFTEITTPIFARSTPEGARDYLVPSRVKPSTFYALPQSPQIFKQLFMVGGMERYFQIAQCFRDEDLRADRQPEFTQLDLEMSFASPADVKTLITDYLKTLFKNLLGVTASFQEMSYAECIEQYGSDKPDIRYGMPLIRIDDIVASSNCAIFTNVLADGGCVKGLCVKGGADLSRKQIDTLTTLVQGLGLKGLAWMKHQDEITSPLAKFFTADELTHIAGAMESEPGDLLLFAAAKEDVVNMALDHLRRHLAKSRNLIPEKAYAFLWVIDFPLFEWDEDEKRLKSLHHPFTSPHPDDIPLLDSDPLKARALAYDIVLNGYELGGGSQRIHDFELQKNIFRLLNFSPDEIESQFGFFVEALQYGTPPHAGIALGFDRLTMLLSGAENIRDVIAFPKTLQASDLMMECPSPVAPAQLKDLGIKVPS